MIGRRPPEEATANPPGHCRRAAGVLLVVAWAFWLHRWVPALLVVAFVIWVIVHHRLEAGLGAVLHRRWRRVWPPGSLVLIALLCASTLAFALGDAPVIAKVMPVGLDVLALSLVLFGRWWTLVTLPGWLGGPRQAAVTPRQEPFRLVQVR